VTDLKNFWLSWYAKTGAYELHWPWWTSGYRYVHRDGEECEEPTIVAAVRAESEEAAKEIVIASHDTPPTALEWRFCEERPDDWTPYESDRFPKAKWMPQWPPTNLVGPRKD